MNLRIISFFLLTFLACKSPENPSVSIDRSSEITPKPLAITKKKENFILTQNTTLYANEKSVDDIANFFIHKIENNTGHLLNITKDRDHNNSIKLLKDDTLDYEKEEYHLDVSENDVVIKAKTDQGLFYGMHTFMQLLPLYKEENKNKPFFPIKIQAVDIKDKPRFSWRGVHLDVSRHFSSVDFIKKQLDVLSIFKINKFHWHLTDDQGWRIEIKKYPKLTSIGSKRKNADGSYHEGYYTQEEIKEVVQYAKERFIDVVPEFDTPGHAIAVLSGYPELACDKSPDHYDVRNLWGVESSIFCASKETTYTFIEDVVKEMAELFPYEYYHMGGDEVPKDQWKHAPCCQKLKKQESIKDEKEIQSYFMARVENILTKYNKKMIGWDEILEGGITPTTNIMSWLGEEGGIKAANEGHDVIMTPSKYVYLNFYQGDHKVEPFAFGGYIPLEKAYNYDPLPVAIKEDKKKHILGSQGNLWTEYAKEDKTKEYLLYPRIIALAETNWTQKENKNFVDFSRRLNNTYELLDHYGINYHFPLPEGPTADKITFIDSVQVPFTTTRPIKMVYTLDGTDPTINSTEYTQPLDFTTTTEIRIASVLDNGKMSPIRKLLVSKEPLTTALDMKKVSKGLVMEEVKGHFKNIKEVEKNTTSRSSIIKNIEDANKTYDWGHKINDDNLRAVFLNGYIDIPEDGVYYFSSTQDQIWIGDKLLIEHPEPIKKHAEESSIALQKGKHKLKIMYLNNVVKGWATDWNTVELKYRKASETEYKNVDEHMIFH